MRVSFIRFAFEPQDLENFLNLEFRRELHVSLTFQPLETSLMLSPALNILSHFFFCKIDPGLFFCRPRPYWGAGSTVLFNLQKTITAFIEVNMKRQIRSIGNHLGGLSFSSEMVSKRVRGIYTMKIKTGLVSFRPPWIIIGLHPG